MHALLVKAHTYQSQRIKCTVADHFVSQYPVSVVFVYQKMIPEQLITEALQHTLNDYPLFAGRLIQIDNHLYIDCNNQGIGLKMVYSDNNLDLIGMKSDIGSLDLTRFVDVINAKTALKKQTPLLTIQVNYYKNATVIGYSWHHSLGDMASFMFFLKSFSACAQKQCYEMPIMPLEREQYLMQWIDNHMTLSNKKHKNPLKILNGLDFLRLLPHFFMPKKSIYLHFTEEEITSLKTSLSEAIGHKLSSNDSVCAQVLNCLSSCRDDDEKIHTASIVVNFRSRIGLQPTVQGNFIDTAKVTFLKDSPPEDIADKINYSVAHYVEDSFCPKEIVDFIEKKVGYKNIGRTIPEDLLPHYKNLVITNWSHFGVYSIDFGIEAPYIFLPLAQSPLPWMGLIVEGFENKGLLVKVILPSRLAKRFSKPKMLEKIHRYRK